MVRYWWWHTTLYTEHFALQLHTPTAHFITKSERGLGCRVLMEVVKDKARYCTLHTVHYTTLHTTPNLPQVPLLVATDLAAKGLDTPGVDFHYNSEPSLGAVYLEGLRFRLISRNDSENRPKICLLPAGLV